MIDLDWDELDRMNLAGQYRGQNPILMKDGTSKRAFLVWSDRKLAPGLTTVVYDQEEGTWLFSGAQNSFANVLKVEEVVKIALPVWPTVGGSVRQMVKDEGEMPHQQNRF